jgi:hypothetical protein
MERYNHTNDTIELFNKVLNDYFEIQSDNDLEERKISYSDYNNLGILIDSLRYEGKTLTHTESIRGYFENLGCVIDKVDNNFIAKLQ